MQVGPAWLRVVRARRSARPQSPRLGLAHLAQRKVAVSRVKPHDLNPDLNPNDLNPNDLNPRDLNRHDLKPHDPNPIEARAAAAPRHHVSPRGSWMGLRDGRPRSHRCSKEIIFGQCTV
jgi:hypothetical protein